MRFVRFAGVVGVVVAGVATANACGGQTSAPSSTGTATDASSQADSAFGVRAAGCPDADPGDQTACSVEGLLCEYGDDFNPLCNATRVCSSGRWAEPIQHGAGGKCPSGSSGPPTIPPNPSDCAADAKSLPPGTCSSTSTCTYDGAVCTCGVFCPDSPIRQPNCDADAGTTINCCDTTKIEWHCFEGPKYCTAPRPRIGAPCTTEGDSCAIGPPVECGQTLMLCQSGIWNLDNTECAASSARVKREIAYVDQEQADRLHEELMSVRLATYRYKSGDEARHLGFIIEDMPPASLAVLPSRDRVDLYGYVSMSVASLQHQQAEIDSLRSEVARLAAELAASRPREVRKPAR